MAYAKHVWENDEIITKEKLNNIENGIAQAETLPTFTLPKLTKINALAGESEVATVVTELNKLIADLKAKGYMTN